MSPHQIYINRGPIFASAPTSPDRSFFIRDTNDMCFYSVPTTPNRGMLDATSDLGTVTTTTMTMTTKSFHDDVTFNLDDFEFETSRLFNVNFFDGNKDGDSDSDKNSDVLMENHQEVHRKRQRHASLPSMAFADELFCDGKVMPLNPPPCRQYFIGNNSDNKYGKYESSPTSPNNPGSVFKLPLPRRSLWNDDFDPFMVALETVKEGKKGAHHRRAWSMLPLRACTQWDPDELIGYEHQKCLHASPLILSANKTMDANVSLSPQQPIKDWSKTPLRLAEPKGVVFARMARMVKMDYNWPNKPTTISVSEPMIRVGDNVELRARPCPRGSKWGKIMSALRRTSMTRTRDEQKPRDQNLESSRPKILRNLNFKSKKLVHCNQKKEVPQMTKMTLVRYRPKLLLCMGYGANYAK